MGCQWFGCLSEINCVMSVKISILYFILSHNNQRQMCELQVRGLIRHEQPIESTTRFLYLHIGKHNEEENKTDLACRSATR